MSKHYSKTDFVAAMGVSPETLERFETWQRLLVQWNARINLVGASTLDDFWHRHALDGAQIFRIMNDLSVRTKNEQGPLDREEQTANIAPTKNAEGVGVNGECQAANRGPGKDSEQKRAASTDLAARDLANTTAAATSIVDIGSGAGIPGLAIAFMLMDQAQHKGASANRVMLVEPSTKRASFLRQVVRETDAPADVVCDKWENLPPTPAALVTSRAFAPLPKLLAAAHHFWTASTLGIFLKGRGVDTEISAARAHYRFALTRTPSQSDADGTILTVKNLTRVSLA